MEQLSGLLESHPVKAGRLKRAAGGRCENCSNFFSPAILEMHILGTWPGEGAEIKDPQKHVLVLCPSCRRSIRSAEGGESLGRELVRHRSREVRKMMREILGYQPRKYIPPDSPDPEVLFREIFESGAPELCLNGG